MTRIGNNSGVPPSVPSLLAGWLPAFAPNTLDRIARTATLFQVRRGAVLVQAGAQTATLGQVIEGTLGMVRVMPQGKPHLMGMLLPGDVFGQLFDGPMLYTVEALTDAVVLTIDRQVYESALAEMPSAEQALIGAMIDDLDAARAWVLILSAAHVVDRVAALFAILMRRQQTHGSAEQVTPVTLRLPLGRRDLARCLSIRPESLSRAFHSLAKEGIIEIVTPDIVRVPDPAALIAASGGAFEISERPTDHRGAKAR